MKTRTLLLALLLLFTGHSFDVLAKIRVSHALERLDSVLSFRQNYIDSRQAGIDSLCAILAKRPSDADLIMQIADRYSGFNNDSALCYLERGMAVTAGAENLPFRWKHAALLPLNGFYDFAFKEYQAVPADSVPADCLGEYYDAGRQLMSYEAASFQNYPHIAGPLREQVLEYQRKLLDVLPHGSVEYKFNMGEYCFLTGSSQKAKVLLEEIVDSEPHDSNLRARAAHHLSSLAKDRGDRDSYIYYLALSATADVLSATREVLSLQELGSVIYDSGDISRAYSYLSNALANAVECGAPLRMVDASRSLPIIERAHMSYQDKSRRTLKWILGIMAVLIFVLIGAMLVLRHQMHKMAQLQAGLRAANAAKEVYISQFLQLCSIYMDKLNQFCKIAARKLAAGQSDELYRMTKSGKFVEEQSSEFYEVFDNAFLHIYPDFVSRVNELLRPECRIELKAGELLNTDLRILAFMRLGIEESSRIAQVLNYSLNTIYAYRNRLKARAVNKDEFERDVMRISSVG
ncbi:MAG: DUF6377 domain-containing protein [Muribaculaceae bacterium]|nr:DUF6377 domain-containing protein [Muribaculaceae bacterium]